MQKIKIIKKEKDKRKNKASKPWENIPNALIYVQLALQKKNRKQGRSIWKDVLGNIHTKIP